jgi:hypothetical protein
MREFDPIDTTGSELIATGPPEPLLAFATGQPKFGRDGKPINTLFDGLRAGGSPKCASSS